MLAFARLVLTAGGMAMLLSGVVLAALGLFAGGWLRSLLPPLAIDTRAVGGAALALGVFVAVVGAAQLAAALSVARAGRWVAAAAAVVSGLLAGLLVACAVAAATQVALGGSAWLLPASAGLMVAAIGYGAGAWGLANASAQPPRASR